MNGKRSKPRALRFVGASSRFTVRRAFVAAGLLVATHSSLGPAFAQRAENPAAGTVFIRVIGRVQVRSDSAWEESKEERDVELGTGSGFVFTPYGHVLTNHHVVSDETFTERSRRGEVTVELEVDRIEVAFPGPTGNLEAGPVRFEASVEAVDEELDLAVLSVNAGELPYLAFGDSDAAPAGETVQVYGFPFGRRVEVGRANLPDIVPTVSVTRGTVSATRGDRTGNPAYLQTSAKVNPGNSGGPMVDREGYVLGVVRLKLRGGDGIGFAIPVNRVKDFLEIRGYAELLPVPRLRLGPEQALPDKGVTIRLPERIEDISQARLRAHSDPSETIVRFELDRVATPWGISELEPLLLGGETFGSFRAQGKSETRSLAMGRWLMGSVNGTDVATAERAKMEYVLLESGLEKLLVRFRGPADAVAFNRSTLVRSLESVRAQPLLTEELSHPLSPDGLVWVRRPLPDPQAPFIEFPESWYDEPGAPFPCRDLPPFASALAASPVGDFTVSMRAAWWPRGPGPLDGAGACGGRAGQSSYAYAVEWLGVAYAVEGVFVSANGELLQLEVVAPETKRALVDELKRSWWRRNAP